MLAYLTDKMMAKRMRMVFEGEKGLFLEYYFLFGITIANQRVSFLICFCSFFMILILFGIQINTLKMIPKSRIDLIM